MTAVFERYPDGGGEMLLALALADHADDDGASIFPAVRTMAQKTRQSIRAVQYQLRRMQDAGWLILVAPARGGRETAGRPAEYRISLDWIKGANFASLKLSTDEAEIAPKGSSKRVQNEALKGATGSLKGAKHDVKGCKAFAPESSVNHHESSEREAGAKISPSLDEKKAEPPTEGTRLHPDWKPNAEQVAFAMSTQPGWDSNRVTREGQKFRNHWLAVPGDRAFKSDWNAMWGKWVLSDDPMRSRAPVAPGGAVTGDWWESDGSTDAQGVSVGCSREKDEPTPKYLVRVAKASGRGPWIDFVLQQAKRSGSDKWFQQVVQYLGEALMPADFYAS